MRERKYIVGLDPQDHLKLKAGYVLFHKDLIDTVKKGFFSEAKDIQPCGGGFWVIKEDEIHLYGESSDFGPPQRLEEALKVDGDNFRRQITMVERRIQGNDDLDYRESPIVYINKAGEKVYPEVGQGDQETKTLPTAPTEKEFIFPVSPRGTNKMPSKKKESKSKKAKRRDTKKRYGKHK